MSIHHAYVKVLFFAGASLTLAQSSFGHIRQRLLAQGELAPLPEARALLIELTSVIDSPAFKAAIKRSRTLEMMRERLRTSLFHLNLKFEAAAENYPYDPPFHDPFPFRPTLEAIEEASKLLEVAQKTTGFQHEIQRALLDCTFFEDLEVLMPEAAKQSQERVWSINDVAAEPVDAYEDLQARLGRHGELAAFPEFEPTVQKILKSLSSDEVRAYQAKDPAFAAYCDAAVAELEIARHPNAKATRVQGAATAPFAYRRTLQALEQAVMVLDTRDRLKYPEGINWHEVELSWYHGGKPKVLGLYHFNRYKYQLGGLLADREVVLWPDADGVSFGTLIRLRVVPIGIIDAQDHTSRLDRHHNTPIDAWYHDANHVRRMWGYDKRKAQKRDAVAIPQKMAIYREQDAFIKDLFAKVDPRNAVDANDRELRKGIRVLMFETIHETALTPDRESLLRDLLRAPATPQPFEVQIQAPISNLEDIRTFDGNLKSGADQLSLELRRPTTVRYFYDRAPGFLANVDNKVRWGFFDSPFDPKNYVNLPEYRIPKKVGESATRLFELLEHPAPPMQELVKQATNRSGQQELWNYFGLKDAQVVVVSGMDVLNVAAADEIHENWRRNSPYMERWKPTNAKLMDGTAVYSLVTMKTYLEERGIPRYAHEHFRLDKDPVSGEPILYEDLRNLPNAWLAPNHRNENMMSGATGVSVVDRIWRKNLNFTTLDDVERWLVAAAQTVHQAVLDRNANGARNNPAYNKHWLLLPSQNQAADLDLIRIAFEARNSKPSSISTEKVTLIREGILRLYRKIRSKQPIRCCAAHLARV